MKMDQIPTTYDDAAKMLAGWHADGLGNGVTIYLFPDPTSVQVRLLEVTKDTIPSGSVIPIGFGTSPDFPFRSAVAQVTPQEWDQILVGTIALPDGWNLDQRLRVWPQP